MIGDSTDEVKGARPIKLHNALAIIECDDGIAYVAVVIAPFVYLKNWIILVIESCKQNNRGKNIRWEMQILDILIVELN